MKLKDPMFAGLFALAAVQAQAAVQNYDLKYRLAIDQDGRMIHETQRRPCGFRVEILSDSEGVKAESSKNGRPFVTASKDERYSVRLFNPLPVRVAVNLTVDGLNSITGKPSGITDGSKWIIEPYSSVTIPGWQVSGEETRRFFFTDKPKSYAKWRGDALNKDLAANCGVIGAAYFWNQRELNQYYETHPIVRYTHNYWPYASNRSEAMDRASADAPACAPALSDYEAKRKEAPEEQAGTGMGERESHPTVQVDFNYDTGMYALAQAVVIYYGFAPAEVPNPFPALGYAPEMP